MTLQGSKQGARENCYSPGTLCTCVPAACLSQPARFQVQSSDERCFMGCFQGEGGITGGRTAVRPTFRAGGGGAVGVAVVLGDTKM